LEILFSFCVLAVLLLAERVTATHRAATILTLAGIPGKSARGRPEWILRAPGDARLTGSVVAIGLAVLLGLIGRQAAGPLGLIAGGVGGAVLPTVAIRRKARLRAELMERQLAELSESAAQAVRSGLSVGQAVEFAHREAEPPMRQAVGELVAQQRLGAPFDVAVERFGEVIGTDDARLLAVILGVHAKAGGNLAGALEEVNATIRHRVALRRELRALSAQGRISGLILASLPIAFSVVLATTSRAKLAPIYASPAGMVMVAGGLVMEALAFLWIRRLLRVDA
jgi:tight adherence protein B